MLTGDGENTARAVAAQVDRPCGGLVYRRVREITIAQRGRKVAMVGDGQRRPALAGRVGIAIGASRR